MTNMVTINPTISIIPLKVKGQRKSDPAEQKVLLSVSGHHPLRARIEQKGGGRVDPFSLLGLRHPPSPALGHWCSRFLSFWTQIRTYAISPLVLRPSDPE